MQHRHDKIVITGVAGLVGQNLLLVLREAGYTQLVGIDKQAHNLQIARTLNPDVTLVQADLAEVGEWQVHFANAACVIQLHAQITGLTSAPFTRNNLLATEHVLNAMRAYRVPYLIHASSSVVVSVGDDEYTRSKTAQEKLVVDFCAEHLIDYVALRPTLMYGWFDPKHFGWLSRLMEKAPIFPIPGDGRFMRQPLYNRDFCRIIARCLELQPRAKIYDVVGKERIDYIDIIKLIKRIKQLKTMIVHLPYRLFDWLLKAYALFSSRPPFTSAQLHALSAGDDFKGDDVEAIFNITLTPIEQAMRETFTDARYSAIIVERTD